jgi:aryl-alcohol dehydrogenase-like predicted oxidoreductase
VGLGTQGGDLTAPTDAKMFQVIFEAIKAGKVNTFDTDINFRYGRSEKTINAVLQYLHHEHETPRDCIFVTTKCGYVPFDVDSNMDHEKFADLLIQEKFIKAEDIVNGVHCLHPNFI